MEPLLVSACLVGVCTRFDGGARPRPDVLGLSETHPLVPVCPEQLGGLGTPRPPAELQGGDGHDVLDGRCRVQTADGQDVTAAFVRGARQVLAVGLVTGAQVAVLKARSPSCGVRETYDGTFTGSLREGPGVTAALLQREGFGVASEEDVSAGRLATRGTKANSGSPLSGSRRNPAASREPKPVSDADRDLTRPE